MPNGEILVFRNAALWDGRTTDITVRDGIVTHAGSAEPADRTINCAGLFVLPAAVDLHVHMRGGPQAAKEDWKSGSRSAIAGGVTLVVDQPNTIPPLSTPGSFAERVKEAEKESLCSFAINSAVTSETPIASMWEAGAMAFGETFFAPSSYGDAVGKDDLAVALRQIAGLGGLATIHAEEILAGDDTTLASHDALRSPAGEARAVVDVQACNGDGCRLYFCHLSTAQSVDAATGLVEVTPHHLLLSREKFPDSDAFAKMNPPLRSEKERKDLFARMRRADVIASDHAPHTREEKAAGFSRAPAGIPGVETLLPLLLAEVLAGRIRLPDLVQKTSVTPSKILGIRPAGFEPGDRADFAIFQKKAVRIDPDTLHSRCGWTPFAGMPAVFPEIVVREGRVVYEGGEFFPAPGRWIPGRGFRSR